MDGGGGEVPPEVTLAFLCAFCLDLEFALHAAHYDGPSAVGRVCVC